jgi:hypothetical protein
MDEMAENITAGPLAKTVLWFKARLKNGMIIPKETVSLLPGQTYLITLEMEPESQSEKSLDALAEIATMAEPLGPVDLARNFDTYTSRVITDEPAS